MYSKLLATLLSSALLGCSGGGGAAPPQAVQPTPKEQIASLEQSGALPKLDRGSDINGPDTNSDGIRDDIEAYIDVNYPGAGQRAAARQFAASLQQALSVDTTSKQTVKQVNIKLMNAVNCVFDQFISNATKQPEAVGAEIEAITTNTKPRLLAYLGFSKALAGTAISLPDGDSCDHSN